MLNVQLIKLWIILWLKLPEILIYKLFQLLPNPFSYISMNPDKYMNEYSVSK